MAVSWTLLILFLVYCTNSGLTFADFCREEGTGISGEGYTYRGKYDEEDACAAKCAEIADSRECVAYAYTILTSSSQRRGTYKDCYTWSESTLWDDYISADYKYNSGFKRGLHSRCPTLGTWFRLETRKGLCLTIPPEEKGHQLFVRSRSGAYDQLWRWSEGRLVSKVPEYAADVNRAHKKDGAKVVAWPPHTRKNQQWEMKGGYIYSSLNGKVMQVNGNVEDRVYANISLVEMATLQTGRAALKQQWHYNNDMGMAW